VPVLVPEGVGQQERVESVRHDQPIRLRRGSRGMRL
jgi:hypothetical protein